jgi:hypothetical protein
MDTLSTVHMWTQIVGKIRMEQSPWLNHSWNSALYVTPSGLTTSSIPYNDMFFEIIFDFNHHELHISTSKNGRTGLNLTSMTVADFYDDIMSSLKEVGIEVSILARPVEVEEAIPFQDDTQHKSYDPEAIHNFWKALLKADHVFKEFRAEFTGKSSPSHFFWGAFDLAVTRFSGRPAPKHPGGAPNCADWVMEEAYSHELSSAGFWPGTGYGEAAFYSYAYPEPDGFKKATVRPAEAFYHNDLGEYLLTYRAVQESDNPDAALKDFLRSTYNAAADLGNWDREGLEYTFTKPSS